MFRRFGHSLFLEWRSRQKKPHHKTATNSFRATNPDHHRHTLAAFRARQPDLQTGS